MSVLRPFRGCLETPMDLLRRSLLVGLGLWLVAAGPTRSQDDGRAQIPSETTVTAIAAPAEAAATERAREVLERAARAPFHEPGDEPEGVDGSKRRLRVRLVPQGALTRPQAIQSLYQILRDNCTPDALAAFAASEEARDGRRSAAAGAGAMLANHPLAALAALLRAHELEPGNASHVVNLAAVTQRLGLPRHTLALLDGLDELHTPHPGAFGVPGRAILLTTRGQALVQLRRLDEAERTLREAMRLSPELAEARINLAHALYRQDDPVKQEEAVRLMSDARHGESVAFAEVLRRCERLGVSASRGDWVEQFGGVEATFDGAVGVLVGGAGEGGAVADGGSRSAGFFIKVNAEGEVVDCGAKAGPRPDAGDDRRDEPAIGLVAAFGAG